MKLPKILAILGISFAVCAYLSGAQFDLLYIDVWCELEPFAGEKGTQYPLSKEQAAGQLLEEARFIISGMIYGFDFSYIPQDKGREVHEQFTLTPVAQIPWGDQNLKILYTELRDEKLWARIEYEPKEFQLQRRNAWLGPSIPSAEGIGKGDLFKGYRQKFSAYEQAVKNAIRNLLRPTYFNKPRRITGQALIEEAPEIFISSGKYVARLRVKLKIRDVLPYQQF
jgi:hypothetical protein